MKSLTSILTILGIWAFTAPVSAQEGWSVLSGSDHLKQAHEIAESTIITDTHVDFPYGFRSHYGEINEQNQEAALQYRRGQFDFERAKKGGLDAPFMSIYIPVSYQKTGGAKELADSLIDFVETMIRAYPDKFAPGLSPAEIEKNTAKGLVSLPMGMENGAPIGKNTDLIDYFFDRGIRYITLAHSNSNEICDSSYDPNKKWNGLSPFGYEVVKKMNQAGMMIDVSHISDSAFYQVIRTSETPVIASHSSCRKFTPGWERNMDDDMIRALKENGGVIQINFGSDFLDGEVARNRKQFQADWKKYMEDNNLTQDTPQLWRLRRKFVIDYPKSLYSTVSKVADHIDHVVAVAGIDYVGIGSDFDGVGDSLPSGLKNVSEYPNLIAELLKRGYSREDIEKICYKNLWRVWNEVLSFANK